MYKLKCIYCGKDFESKRATAKSCGSRDKVHRPNEKVKTTRINCAYCNIEFEVANSHLNRQKKRGAKTYCGATCMGNAYKSRVTLTCFHCGVEYERAKSYIRPGQQYNFCSMKCQKDNIDYVNRSENHYNYVDGKSSLPRGKGWVVIRREIRERDDYTCQRCGIKENEYEKALDVHHIKNFKDFNDPDEANDPSNLISYCHSCHMKVHTELSS